MVIEAKIKGSYPYVPPRSTFIFSLNPKLQSGIVIKDFVSTVSNDGIYNVMVENNSLHTVCLVSTQSFSLSVRDSTVGASWFLRKINKYKCALVEMFY